MKIQESFFYGLYMDEELLNSLGFKPTSARKGVVYNYALDLRGSAKIYPKQNSQVWGMLFTLSDNELQLMYSYESTKLYKPETIIVNLTNDDEINARCYNLTMDENAEFNADYHHKLLTLCERLSFPNEYIQDIENMRKIQKLVNSQAEE